MKLVSFSSLLLTMLVVSASVGCKNRNYPPPPATDAEGARFGEGAAESGYPDGEYGSERGGAPGSENNNRFGFSGNNNEPGPSQRDVRDMGSGVAAANDDPSPPKKEEPEVIKKPDPPKKKGPPSVSEMKFANRVAGNPLSVTLSGSGSSLGAISVEKYDSSGKPTGEPLPRGTPVEIQDPNNPGQKIYFKVP